MDSTPALLHRRYVYYVYTRTYLSPIAYVGIAVGVLIICVVLVVLSRRRRAAQAAVYAPAAPVVVAPAYAYGGLGGQAPYGVGAKYEELPAYSNPGASAAYPAGAGSGMIGTYNANANRV
ncbi:hypothetical protein HDU84_006903 [Entophlyctis sp. JEL0112]|nr:hypothetical protein HDU84_006903 [Entophlyctis sp. JEL0112]